MTTTDRTTAPDSEWRAVAVRFEARPHAEESAVERVAQELCAAARGWASASSWSTAHPETQDLYRHLAQAAIDAMTPPAPDHERQRDIVAGWLRWQYGRSVEVGLGQWRIDADDLLASLRDAS